MEHHDCLKDNVIDSCCACYILCRWIVILCCHHIMMRCACSILCHWVVRLCCINIMMSCVCYILCRWVVILCCHHAMMSCSWSIICRWIVILCCRYIMVSRAFSISCRWVVALCCQNNIIILCCHHIMTSCASFILCCWVTMLHWMFGTDLTFGTNELPVGSISVSSHFAILLHRSSVASIHHQRHFSPKNWPILFETYMGVGTGGHKGHVHTNNFAKKIFQWSICTLIRKWVHKMCNFNKIFRLASIANEDNCQPTNSNVQIISLKLCLNFLCWL